MTRTRQSTSTADTEAIGRELADSIRTGAVVFLSGPLGAGKTLFAKAVFAGLGVDPHRVTSPTFKLVNRYRSATDPAAALHHIDLYRIEGQADLESLGLDEVFETPGGVVLVEWAERLERWPGLEPIEITIDDDGGDCRTIRITVPPRPSEDGSADPSS